MSVQTKYNMLISSDLWRLFWSLLDLYWRSEVGYTGPEDNHPYMKIIYINQSQRSGQYIHDYVINVHHEKFVSTTWKDNNFNTLMLQGFFFSIAICTKCFARNQSKFIIKMHALVANKWSRWVSMAIWYLYSTIFLQPRTADLEIAFLVSMNNANYPWGRFFNTPVSQKS